MKPCCWPIETCLNGPEAVESVILLREQDDRAAQQTALHAGAEKSLEKRIARLIAAIESGSEVGPCSSRLRELEARQTAIDDRLRGLDSIRRLPAAGDRGPPIRVAEVLRSSTTQGQDRLQKILDSPITFTPREDGSGYDFSCPTRFDTVFSGIVTPGQPVSAGNRLTSLRRTRSRRTRAVLENAITGKGWRARRDLNPRPTGSKPAALSN